MQNRVKRRRLTRTGRARYQNHPVRGIDRLAEFSQRRLVHSHLVDTRGKRRLIENTDNDLFTVRGRQNRNTKIDVFAHHLNAKASILRHAPLRDVQAGQNFDARRDGQLQRLGRRFGQHEFAVHAVAQLERVHERLDVNVRRLLLDRLGQDQIDNLDDGRLFAIGSETIEIDVFAFGRLNFHALGRLRRFFRHLPEHLAHVRPVMDPGQGIGHGALRRDHRDNFELCASLQIVDREHVRRVGHRHKKFSVQTRDRHELVRLGHVARNQRHDLFRDAHLGQVDRWRVQATPHAEGHVLLGDELFVRQDLEQTAAFAFLEGDCFLELIGQEQAVVD